MPLEHWGESRRFKRFSRPEKIFPILASKCSSWSISIISLWYNNFTIQNLRDIPFFLSIKVCWKVWTFFATVWGYTYYGLIVQGHIQIGTRATCTTKRFQRIHWKSRFIKIHITGTRIWPPQWLCHLLPLCVRWYDVGVRNRIPA